MGLMSMKWNQALLKSQVSFVKTLVITIREWTLKGPRSFLADENENPAAKTPRKAAIFAVTAPAQALTPAADIARVLQTAQLRNCLRDDDVVRNEPNKGTYWGFPKSRLPVRPDYARLFAHTSHESHAPTLADSRLTLFFPKSQFRNRSPTSWP